MSSVDNRIVNMMFNHKEFTQGISESTDALNKFSQNLNNFSGSSSAFTQLESAVTSIADRFTWLGDFAFRAMGRVKDAILDVVQTVVLNVQNIANPFAEISSGFSEYETKINAIQTIMSGVRQEFKNDSDALTAVNNSLAELNDYADRTIYSFSDMTQNIGKFTNAGVGLEKSVKAIQGVANVAAISGANANEASRAMYNFGQALGSGVIRLMDWKSIENANMATVEFKQQLIDAAVAAGTLKKVIDPVSKTLKGYTSVTTDLAGKTIQGASAQELFVDGLSNRWLTSDVLIKTLNDYASLETEIGKRANEAATSVKTFSQFIDTLKESLGTGWADTFELIIGGFNESKTLWTDVSKSVETFTSAQSKARNETLLFWKNLGGRDQLIQGLANAFKALGSVLGTIGDAFKSIFPPSTPFGLVNITKKFNELMASLRPSEQMLERLTRIWKGFFAIIDLIITPLQIGVGVITKFVGALFDASNDGDSFVGSLIEMVSVIGDFVVSINEAFQSATSFSDLWNKLTQAISKFGIGEWKAFENFLKESGQLVDVLLEKLNLKDAFYSMAESIKAFFVEVFTYVKDIDFSKFFSNIDFYGILESLTGFFDENPIITGLVNGIQNGIKFVVDAVLNLGQIVIDRFKALFGISSPSKVFYEFGINLIEGLVNGIKSVYNYIITAIFELGNLIITNFDKVFTNITSFFTDLGIKISESFTIGYSSLSSFLDNLKQADFSILDAIKSKFESMVVENTFFGKIIAIFNKFIEDNKPIWDWFRKTFGPMIDWLINEFKRLTLSDIGHLLFGIGTFKTGSGLVKLADNLKYFSKVVKNLNLRNFPGPFRNFISVISKIPESITEIFTKLGDSLRAFSGAIKAKSLLVIAIAVGLLALALSGLSKIPYEKLQVGLVGITTLLTELVLALKGLDAIKGFGGPGITKIIAISIAIGLMAKSLISLGDIKGESILASIAVLSSLMGILVIFSKFGAGGKIQVGSLQLIAFAYSLKILVSAFNLLKDINLSQLGSGLIAFFSILAGIGVFAKVAGSLFTKLGRSLLGFSAGLWLITKIIKGLSDINIDKLKDGLLALILILGSIGLTLGLLNKFLPAAIPNLLNFSAGMYILQKVIVNLGEMNFGTLVQGVLALAAALGAIAGVLGVVNKFLPGGTVPKIFGLAIGLIALTYPIEMFGRIDLWTLAKGIVGVGAALGIIGAVLTKFPNAGSIKLIGLSIGLIVLSKAINIFGKLDFDDLMKGLIGVAGGLLIAVTALAAFKKTGLGLKNFASISAGLILFAAALTLFMVPIIAMGLLPWNIIKQGLIVFGAALLGLATAILLLPRKSELIGISVGLLAIEATLGIMMLGIIALGEINTSILSKGLLALATAILAIITVVKAMPTNLPMISLGLIGIATALTALMYVVREISKLSLEDLVKGIAGLTVVLFDIWLATQGLSNIGVMSATALGIALLAGALTLLMNPLNTLANFNWGQWGKAIGGFIAIMGGAVLLAPKTIATSLSLIAFGTSVGLVAGGVWLLVEALNHFMEMVISLPSKVRELGGAIKDELLAPIAGYAADAMDWTSTNVIDPIFEAWDYLFGAKAAEAAETIGTSMVDGFIYGSDEMGRVTKVAIKDVNKNFEQINLDKAKETIKTNYEETAEVVKTSGTEIVDEVKEITLSISTAASDISSDVISKPLTAAIDEGQVAAQSMDIKVITPFKEKLNIIDDYLKSKIGDFPNTLSQLYTDNMSKISLTPELDAMFTNATQSIQNGGSLATEEWNNLFRGLEGNIAANENAPLNPTNLSKKAETALASDKGLKGGIKRSTPQVGYAMVQMGDTIIGSVRNGTDPSQFYQMTSKAFVSKQGMLGAIESSQMAINQGLVKTTTALNESLSKNATAAGLKIVEGIDSSLIQGEAVLATQINKTDTTTQQAFMKALDSNKYVAIGKQPITGLTTGIEQSQPVIITKANELSTNISTTFTTSLSIEQFQPIGIQIVNGLIAGINIQEPELIARVQQMAQAIQAATTTSLEVQSPSKVFMRIGQFVVEGLAQGINSNAKIVETASKSLGDYSVGILQSMLSAFSFNDLVDMDLNPTITPVLDLNNVQMEASKLPTLLNQATSSVKMNAAITASSMRTSNQNGSQITQPQQSTSQNTVNMTNTFNVKNESDARTISNRLGTLLNRAQYAKGVVSSI